MAPAVHYMAILKKHAVIVTLVLTICWSLGNTDNPISGSGIIDDCSNPQNVNVSISSPTANVTVTWDLPLAPFVTCMYNYTVMFTVGSIELVEATSRLLTDEEITDCRLVIPPSILRSDLDMFEPGVTVVVNISLVDGDSSTGSINIPGVFAPPVTNFSVTMVSSMSLTLQWGLAYDPAVPTSYNISYRFRDLTDNTPVQGPVTEIVSENNTLDNSSSDLAITYVVDGLQAFSEYNLTMTAVYGETNISTSLATNGRTTESAPSSPLNFTLEQVTDQPGQLNASWISPMDRNGILRNYSVSCRITLDQFYDEQVLKNLTEFTQRTSTVGDTTTTILMDLEPFTKYQCQVTASTDGGESPVSNSDNATTDEAAPTEPVGLNVSNRTATSISLQWSRPLPTDGIIIMYTLNYTGGSISDTINIPVEPVSQEYNVTSMTVDSLNEFTNYTFNLSATTGGGVGPAATLPDVLTNEAAPSAAPVNVTGMNTSSTSLRISWFPPPMDGQNGIITAYNITYVTAGENEMIDSTLGSTQFIELTGLRKFRTYNISVAASTSVGIGPSETVIVTTDTDVPSAPQELQYTNLSSTSIQVTWRPPMSINGIFQRYIIMVTQLNPQNSMNQTLDTSDVNVTMFNITNLEEFERYTIVVYGETDAGVGPGSDPLYVLTDEGVPSAPRNVTLRNFSATDINVTWIEPSSRNGVITHYTISYIGTKPNNNNNFGGRINRNLFVNDSSSSRSVSLANLLADTLYSANVTAFTSVGAGDVGIGNTIQLPVGPPPQLNISEPSNSTSVSPRSFTINFMIPEEANANGPITRFIIIIRVFGSTNDQITTYFESVRHDPPDQAPPYQAVEQRQIQGRKRQNEVQNEMVVIGDPDMMCGPNNTVCNGPLNPNTEYQYKYRLYTNDNNSQFIESGYSAPISTAVAATETTTIIVIAVVVSLVFIIAIIIIIVVVLIIYRSRREKGGKYDFMKTNGRTAGLADSKSSTETNIPLVASGPSIVPLSDNLPHTKPVAPKAAGKISHTRKVYMRDLPGYITDMMSDSGYKFSEEYEKVTAIGLEHSKDASLMPENRAKNRYTNILAYDHSRVKLSSIDDEPGSDYINANYIPGYRMRRAYIATQGPLPSTFDDFWNMVWEQNTHNIIMLTQLVERGRTKCHRYWPGTQSEVYADIIVEMMSEKELSEWTFRELRLTKEKRSRIVKHFQFTSWPDHGVPESPSSVIDFVREVRGSVQGPHGPMVIHCSAGVGRTGTFIGLDTLLQHIKDHDWVDIFGLACEMRLHRNHMIQTEAQYVFIHKSMLEVCEYLTAYKSFENKLDFSPIYTNPGVHSQTDMYGDLLSEEVSQEKSYDETKM